MTINEVVTCILKNNNKILILKRSQKVGSQRGKWAGVSGFLEEKTPLDQAYKEINEETALVKEDILLIKKARFLDFPDTYRESIVWRVYPFLFEVKYPEKIVLDWEHDEMKWISLTEINEYSTMVDFNDVIKNLFSD